MRNASAWRTGGFRTRFSGNWHGRFAGGIDNSGYLEEAIALTFIRTLARTSGSIGFTR